MQSTTKPSTWTLSPSATEAPELWRGVTFLTAYWEGVGSKLLDLSGNGYDANIVNGPPWINTTNGIGVDYNGSTQYADPGGDVGVGNATRLTIVTSLILKSLSPDAAIVRKWKSGSQAFIFGVSNPNEQDDRLRFLINDNSQNAIIREITNTELPTNRFVTIGGTWRGGDTIDLYQDGDLISSDARGGNVTPSEVGDVSEHMSLMARYNGGSVDLHADGIQLFVYVATQERTDAEMRLLTSDPFKMLRPREF